MGSPLARHKSTELNGSIRDGVEWANTISNSRIITKKQSTLQETTAMHHYRDAELQWNFSTADPWESARVKVSLLVRDLHFRGNLSMEQGPWNGVSIKVNVLVSGAYLLPRRDSFVNV